MKVENLKREGNIVSFEVEEEYSELEKHMNRKYKEQVKKVKIPGFRQGKAPKHIFINAYGKDRLMYDSVMDFLNEIYPQIVEDKELSVIDYPKDIEILQLEDSKPVKVKLSVDVKPTIKVGKYKGVKLEKNAVNINDGDVKAEIDKFLENHSTHEDDSDAIISKDDLVTLKCEAVADGIDVEVWTKDDMSLKVGAGYMLAEFEEEIKGLKQGEKKDFTVKLAEDFSQKDLAGKSVDFSVEIITVKAKKLPELTDDFISDKTDKLTVDDYKKDVEDKLRASSELEANNKLKDDVKKLIVKDSKVEVPKIMIEKEIDQLIRKMEYGISQFNIRFEDYLKMINKSIEDLREEYKLEAEDNVKYSLALEEIAKLEKMEVSEAEIDEEIDDLVSKITDNDQKEEARKSYGSMRGYMKDNLLDRKVEDFILGGAKVKIKKK